MNDAAKGPPLSRIPASSSASVLIAAAAVMARNLLGRDQRASSQTRVPVVVPDGGPEGLLVRETARLRVAGQVVRDRGAAPLGEIPLDGGLPLGGLAWDRAAERVRPGLPAGPAHQLLGGGEPLQI